MAHLTDIEIAQACRMRPIYEVAARIGIPEEFVEPYGKYKAKILPGATENAGKKPGHLVLVTAMTPTPAGEGKTTTTLGLVEGLGKLGKRVIGTVRQPSGGPTFNIKGSAALFNIIVHFSKTESIT